MPPHSLAAGSPSRKREERFLAWLTTSKSSPPATTSPLSTRRSSRWSSRRRTSRLSPRAWRSISKLTRSWTAASWRSLQLITVSFIAFAQDTVINYPFLQPPTPQSTSASKPRLTSTSRPSPSGLVPRHWTARSWRISTTFLPNTKSTSRTCTLSATTNASCLKSAHQWRFQSPIPLFTTFHSCQQSSKCTLTTMLCPSFKNSQFTRQPLFQKFKFRRRSLVLEAIQDENQ